MSLSHLIEKARKASGRYNPFKQRPRTLAQMREFAGVKQRRVADNNKFKLIDRMHRAETDPRELRQMRHAERIHEITQRYLGEWEAKKRPPKGFRRGGGNAVSPRYRGKKDGDLNNDGKPDRVRGSVSVPNGQKVIDRFNAIEQKRNQERHIDNAWKKHRDKIAAAGGRDDKADEKFRAWADKHVSPDEARASLLRTSPNSFAASVMRGDDWKKYNAVSFYAEAASRSGSYIASSLKGEKKPGWSSHGAAGPDDPEVKARLAASGAKPKRTSLDESLAAAFSQTKRKRGSGRGGVPLKAGEDDSKLHGMNIRHLPPLYSKGRGEKAARAVDPTENEIRTSFRREGLRLSGEDGKSALWAMGATGGKPTLKGFIAQVGKDEALKRARAHVQRKTGLGGEATARRLEKPNYFSQIADRDRAEQKAGAGITNTSRAKQVTVGRGSKKHWAFGRDQDELMRESGEAVAREVGRTGSTPPRPGLRPPARQIGLGGVPIAPRRESDPADREAGRALLEAARIRRKRIKKALAILLRKDPMPDEAIDKAKGLLPKGGSQKLARIMGKKARAHRFSHGERTFRQWNAAGYLNSRRKGGEMAVSRPDQANFQLRRLGFNVRVRPLPRKRTGVYKSLEALEKAIEKARGLLPKRGVSRWAFSRRMRREAGEHGANAADYRLKHRYAAMAHGRREELKGFERAHRNMSNRRWNIADYLGNRKKRVKKAKGLIRGGSFKTHLAAHRNRERNAGKLARGKMGLSDYLRHAEKVRRVGPYLVGRRQGSQTRQGAPRTGVYKATKADLEAFRKAKPKTLYVYRPLEPECAAEFIAWAKSQGFKSTLKADDLHCTIAYSKTPVNWARLHDDWRLEPAEEEARRELAREGLSCAGYAWSEDGKKRRRIEGGSREVKALGKDGAVVLAFESITFTERWADLRRAGASWDYPSYTPHVTITYDGSGVDLSKVEPFKGALIFGEECWEEIKPNAQKEIAEQSTGLKKAIDDLSARLEAVEKRAAA